MAAAFWEISAWYYWACWVHRNIVWDEHLMNFSALKMLIDETGNLPFWSWWGIDQRQKAAHLPCPVSQHFIKVFFIPGRRKGDQMADLISLFSQKQIQFPFNTCNNNSSHMCFTLCRNCFSELWVAVPLIFSVLDHVLLVCPATSITTQKTSASPLRRIFFFSTLVTLKLFSIFPSEAFLTEISSRNLKKKNNKKKKEK